MLCTPNVRLQSADCLSARRLQSNCRARQEGGGCRRRKWKRAEKRKGAVGRGGKADADANRYLCGLTDGVPAGQTDELLLLHVTRRGVNTDLVLILPRGQNVT